ncbi:MAG: porin family protein [Hyphomicrobiales bacterium]|nr:porin family protein [Hyphomicrobiales bacterium]
MKARRLRLSGVAAAALALSGPPMAHAADLLTLKEPPAQPVFFAPPFTWTGFYVGLNAGGVLGAGSRSTTLYDASFPLLSAYYPDTLGTAASGWLGGGQTGMNWQWGGAVFGVETDIDWTSMNKTYSFTSAPLTVYVPGDIVNVNASGKLDWLGTTRARIGFVATPDYRLMFYGTGGLAYGGGAGCLNVFDNLAGLAWHGAPSSTRLGWTLGAGVEYAITDNVTLRGEYLYYNLGSSNVVTVPNLAARSFFPDVYAAAKYDYDGSIVRIGVSFKF